MVLRGAFVWFTKAMERKGKMVYIGVFRPKAENDTRIVFTTRHSSFH